MATPCVAITPQRFDEIVSLEDYLAANLMALRNTAVGNYLGLCAITLPVGLDAASMPVGLQLLARPLQDETLLKLGMTIERQWGVSRRRLGKPPHRNRGLLECD